MNKIVSVIIPTQNRKKLLKNALNSVIKQTYDNIEIIVIDDASDDDTAKYIKNLNLNNLKYIKNKTSLGGSASRNVGIKKSNGYYIAFLDDDDIWKPKKIEKQVKLFKKNNVGLIYTGVLLNYVDLNICYQIIPDKKGKRYKDILIKNFIGVTPSVMIKREVIENCGLFDENLPARQDYDFWIRILKKYKIDYINEPLVISNNRMNIDRITKDVNNYKDAIQIIENKYKDDINNLLNKDQKVKRKAEQFYFLGAQSIKANNIKLSRKYFKKSIKVKYSLKSIFAYLSTFLGMKGTIYLRKYFGYIKKLGR